MPTPPQTSNNIVKDTHALFSPLWGQQQNDFARAMNAAAAATGDINAGGYVPDKLGRGMADLVAKQGATEAGFLQQANESNLDRLLGIFNTQAGMRGQDLSLEGSKYGSDAGVTAARYGADASAAAAGAAAGASRYGDDLRYQLGVLNADITREDNLTRFLAQMFGIGNSAAGNLLNGSPESFLGGQTIPPGTVIVK